MKPLAALCIASGSCRLASILRMANNRAEGGELQQPSNRESLNKVSIAAKVLEASSSLVKLAEGSGDLEDLEYVKGLAMVSGSPNAVKRFINYGEGSRGRDMRIDVVRRNRYSVLVKLSVRAGAACMKCLALHTPRGVLPIANLVSPYCRIAEVLILNRAGLKELSEMGYRVVRAEELDLSKYALTPYQQEVLYAAFRKGYYDYPRRVKLEELAKEFNLSATALAEILHRAEAKIIRMFIGSEMPHLALNEVLSDLGG